MRKIVKPLKIFAVGAAVLGLLGATNGTASAAGGSAWNGRYQYLTGAPQEGAGSSCKPRQIDIASYTYTWGFVIKSGDHPLGGPTYFFTKDYPYAYRNGLFLAGGTYTWNDCITQHNGYYSETSTLSTPGHTPITLKTDVISIGDGNFTWGTILSPN